MSEPLDTQAVAWIAGLLGAISITNGYRTDAGADVRTEQLDLLAEDIDGPRIGVEDTDENATGQGRLRRSADLTCVLHVLVPVVIANARVITRRVLADVRLALAQAQRSGNWPVGVTGLEIGSRQMAQREDSAHVVSGELTVLIKFTEHYQETAP